MRFPLHEGTRRRDRRYSIRREFCGYPKPQWVLRFCDDWVDRAPTRDGALTIALRHQSERYAKMEGDHGKSESGSVQPTKEPT